MQKVYHNGTIITMEQAGQIVEAVLVQDGIIRIAGSLAEVEAQKAADAEIIDLQGHTMLPAFIDAHGHISLTATFADYKDLSSAKNFDDIVSLLKEYQKEKNLAPGETIVGYSYDHNFLAEGTHPDKSVLDRVSTEHPVFILHTSIHMGVANSFLLEELQITDATPNPAGGTIGRLPGGAEPNGYLEETAMHQVLMEKNLVGSGDMISLCEKAQEIYLENGITTVQDGSSSQGTLDLFAAMGKMNKLKLDVVLYPVITGDGRDVMKKNPDYVKKYVNHCKLGGYKLILDGAPQSKSAWMTQPYEGESEYRGYPSIKEEVAQESVQQAIDDNQQLLCHCNGDASSDLFLHSYQKALAKSTNANKHNLRPVMIHCQTVRDDQLKDMAQIQMIPSIFVAHTYYWGDVHLKNLGPVRGPHISPCKVALEQGLIYNFHTDTPVVKPLLLHTVWAAVNRRTIQGQEIGPDQQLSVYDALKGITINAAYSYFEEDSKGSIKAGKRADLVILDQNPLTVDKMSIKDIQVLETIKDGETVYKK